MIFVTKIRMQRGCKNSQNLEEIESLYLSGNGVNDFYPKAMVHDHVKNYPGSIKVDIYPRPNVIAATSKSGEKYVKSAPNSSGKDNLLALPRE